MFFFFGGGDDFGISALSFLIIKYWTCQTHHRIIKSNHLKIIKFDQIILADGYPI